MGVPLPDPRAGRPVEGVEPAFGGPPMQDWPLTADKFIDHAARWHGSTEIVSRDAGGLVSRTGWADLRLLAKRISSALLAGNIGRGDRVATLAMNGADHLAAWFGIMGIGAVCHTLNPRLAEEQLAYIVADAADRIVFADRAFEPLMFRLAACCPSIERVVWLGDDGPDGLAAFTAGHGTDGPWGQFDERSPAALCYTSGTTGRPKGVVYTHRSNYLHALMVMQPDVFGVGSRDVWLPVVPMFHANAWGLTYAAAAAGAKLVMPGRHLDGASLYALMCAEEVTAAAGVPTVWQGLLRHVEENHLSLGKLERVLVGGAACSPALFEAFEARGIRVQNSWGMTEVSPLGTTGTLNQAAGRLPAGGQTAARLKQGRVPMGVDMRVVDAARAPLARDGTKPGHLQVRGHSIVDTYFKADRSALSADGYFDTGDIATIDPLGYMQITDRAKDVIKSGGEWISSLDLENAVLTHPGVDSAAVIGVPHATWNERPLLLVKVHPGRSLDVEALRGLLARHFARWELPDVILRVRDIPLGATGKIDKTLLRERFAEGGIAALAAL